MAHSTRDENGTKLVIPAHQLWKPGSSANQVAHNRLRAEYRLEREAFEERIDGHPAKWNEILKARKSKAAIQSRRLVKKVKKDGTIRKMTPLQIKMLRARSSDGDDSI